MGVVGNPCSVDDWLTVEMVENEPEPFDHLPNTYASVAAVNFKLVSDQTGNECCYNKIANLFFVCETNF